MKNLILFLLFCPFLPIKVNGQWILAKADSTFKVFLHEDWRENNTYKAEGIYEVPMDSLYQFLIDFSSYTQWINYCTKVELLHANKNESYIYYAFYDLPWPLANREAITEIKINNKQDSSIVVSSNPIDIEHQSYANAKLVTTYYEQFELIPINENEVLFKMQGSYHPGGFIPEWIKKKFLIYGPYDILLKIRKIIEKEDITRNSNKK